MRFEKYGETLALRIVKLITSVQCSPSYDGFLPIPTEGELVHVRRNGNTLHGLQRALKPWTVPKRRVIKDEAIQDLLRVANTRQSAQ